MKTILSCEFKHETSRYIPGVTSFSDYEKRNAVVGEEAVLNRFAGAQNETTGFYDFFRNKDGYQVKSVLAYNAAPGAPVDQKVWQFVADSMVSAIRQTPKVDGLLLSLHGAMVTEQFEDGEGELLKVLREQVGKEIPIIVTLDLHANITQKMVDNADGLYPCDYYPHTDMYENGLRAAECMYRTLEGEIWPVLRWKKLDLIFPTISTAQPVLAGFVRDAQALRNYGKILNVNIGHGFFASDIYEQGACVVAITDRDADLAQKTANDLGDRIFAARKDLTRKFYTAQEAVQEALNSDSFPVVLADVADNPGAGGSTDAPELLRAMIEMDVQDAAAAVICDPEVVKQAISAGVGATIEVSLAGKAAPELTGGPIECTGYVKAITDGWYRNQDKMCKGLLIQLGPTVLLQVGGVDVIVCSYRAQPWDLEVYRHIGISPEKKKILMVKSAVHFRASFERIAAKILDVHAPALAPQMPDMLPLAHSRRPIYPMDDI